MSLSVSVACLLCFLQYAFAFRKFETGDVICKEKIVRNFRMCPTAICAKGWSVPCGDRSSWGDWHSPWRLSLSTEAAWMEASGLLGAGPRHRCHGLQKAPKQLLSFIEAPRSIGIWPVCLIPSWRKGGQFYHHIPTGLSWLGKNLPDTSSPLPSGLLD